MIQMYRITNIPDYINIKPILIKQSESNNLLAQLLKHNYLHNFYNIKRTI